MNGCGNMGPKGPKEAASMADWVVKGYGCDCGLRLMASKVQGWIQTMGPRLMRMVAEWHVG